MKCPFCGKELVETTKSWYRCSSPVDICKLAEVEILEDRISNVTLIKYVSYIDYYLKYSKKDVQKINLLKMIDDYSDASTDLLRDKEIEVEDYSLQVLCDNLSLMFDRLVENYVLLS